MFSGHITIQYMFCMYLMIKKIILEGFNDRGGANVRGRRGKTSKRQKIIINHQQKIIRILMFFNVFNRESLNILGFPMFLIEIH